MVNILICTYNGEKYLSEQLDSILNQTYKDINIYIQDDGSNDSTMNILNQYAAEHPTKIHLVDAAKHLGYPDCFWHLLKECPHADYYSFCDQDDIWYNTKIEDAVKKLSEPEIEEVPRLYIHDYDICDSRGNLIGKHILTEAGDISHIKIMFYTIAQGFSMVIDNKLRDIILDEDLFKHDLSHDQWMIWSAFFRGKIVYDNAVQAKYRRHESTATKTAAGTTAMLANWVSNEIFGDEFHRQCERLKYFLKTNAAFMNAKQCEEWAVLLFTNRAVHNYFKRLFFPRRIRPSLGGEIALRINFLLGMN